MRKIYFLLLMALSILNCGFFPHKPKGDLIYCSYSCRGAAGLGSDWCELIADPDGTPKVKVVLDADNRFGDPVIRREYPVERSVVDSLAQLLADARVYRLNGYHVEEPICGGHSYRIHMEYASGDQVTAFWYGSHIKESAWSAYHLIERFFSPWYSRAQKDKAALTEE